MSSWTFGRKVSAGFAIAVLALVVVGVTGYRNTTALIANDELVAHSHLVRRKLADVQAQIVNVETGQRGFTLTGREEFLDPYKSGLVDLEKAYSELRQLLSDNPVQLRRLEELRAPIDGKLAHIKAAIDLRRSGGIEPVIAKISAGDGKNFMDQVRNGIDLLDFEESTLLANRAKAAEASAELTTSVIAWGTVAAIVLIILAAWLIISSLTKQIGTAVRHIQSSSTELQAAANQQASGSREQSTAMTEIATTINELLATSRQIADSAQRVSQIASQTASSATSGETTVAKAAEAATTVRKQVDLIVNHMLELGKKSQQVGSVLDIVSELAEQTNILAINATIEAAGAGEAGRRFGVVADEIRKLADRVAGSTKEIRGMVEDVRSAVNTTVMATETGSKAVDVGASRALEMASAFRQIASLVGTTTDAAREIELSTKQQATAVEQVNIAITNVAQATRETEASAAQTLQTSTELTTLSSQLTKIVQARAEA